MTSALVKNTAIVGGSAQEDSDDDATFAPNFVFYAAPYTNAVIGGSGFIYGTNQPEPIIIRDVPGTISLDGSFNRGSDEVSLPGNSANWQVDLYGSVARFNDGDTNILIPVGTAGLALGFADGIRILHGEGDIAKIGDQVIDATPRPVQSDPIENYLGIDTPMSNEAFLYVSPGEPVMVYSGEGPISVTGTAGAEHLVLMGGTVHLDGSFNHGGDIVTLQMSVTNCTAETYGSQVRLHTTALGRFMDITIPVGTAGIELQFNEGSRTLIYDEASQHVLIGDQVILAEPTALVAFG
jgi:hypothetical protein